MAPLLGVTSFLGDITSVATANRVIAATEGHKAELVICDGAPDVTGLHQLDGYLQAQLLLAAFSITVHLLAPGGFFVAKIFRTAEDPRAELLVSQMRCFFPEREDDQGGVWIRKPRSSREGSGGTLTPRLPLKLPLQRR
jgi:tRNA (cytidine32/guanosine34-2'-O)-methyltransferase